MAQENPADTAGPSSPPPRLPEGWLPQWEGVQRKWYYVQRATGKSQWEIPTEPVVLTPSTTPTSIGTGPSQAPPSRPSTNSPQVTGSRRTEEQSEYVAQTSKNLSSLDAQFAPQAEYPSHGDSYTNWNTGLAGHYSTYHTGPGIGTGRSEYDLHSSTGNTVPGITSLHSGYNHLQGPMNHPSMVRDRLGTTEDISNHLIHGHSGMLGTENGRFRDQRSLPEYSPRAQPDRAGHELQWQPEQQHVPSNAYTQFPPPQSGPSGMSQPIHSTYATTQSAQDALGAFMSHSLHSENPQQSRYAQQHAPYGTAVHPSSHVYPPPSTTYSQYHSTSMGRTQSGPGVNSLGFPATPEAQGDAQNYRNPLVQAGLQQYISQQHAGYPSGGSVHPGPGRTRQAEPPPGPQGEWSTTNMPLRTAASDPQFVSGPWSSSTLSCRSAASPSPRLTGRTMAPFDQSNERTQ